MKTVTEFKIGSTFPPKTIRPESSLRADVLVRVLQRTIYRLEMGVSGNLWIVVKDVKTLVVYDVE